MNDRASSMKKKTLRENTVFISLQLVYNFFVSMFWSLFMLVGNLFTGKSKPLGKNSFFEMLDFILQSGPRNFWKKPTAIKIGRSIATLIHYVYYKKDSFTEKK